MPEPLMFSQTANWFNAVVFRVTHTNTHVYFNHAFGGFVYRTTIEQWNSGTITKVN